MSAARAFRLSTAVPCAIVLLASGCASITGSEIQNIALSTRSENGAALPKADCELKNDKGQWKTVTPGFVAVQRSAEDLLVTCTKTGEKDGMLRAISRAAGGMFGNIIFGGGIGALIDHNKGTGYDYPDSLLVEMGKSSVRDKQTERDELRAAGNQPAAAPPAATISK
jgi:hypothetical protein